MTKIGIRSKWTVVTACTRAYKVRGSRSMGGDGDVVKVYWVETRMIQGVPVKRGAEYGCKQNRYELIDVAAIIYGENHTRFFLANPTNN